MATEANSVPYPTVVKVDPFIPAREQKGLHNRWHPDIPALTTVKPGQVFSVECVGKQLPKCFTVTDNI